VGIPLVVVMWKIAVMKNAVLIKLACTLMLVTLGTVTVFARSPEGARGQVSRQGNYEYPQRAFGIMPANQSSQQETDNNQRHGKLSPDERRELRRQIDEAGQDIYRPKR